MPEATRQIMMAGMPNTGKTSFLAALWQVLESSELSSGLTLHAQPPDRTYLNEIRSRWESCTPVVRTSASVERYITLELRAASTGRADLVIPDVSGEAFREMWCKRTVTKRLSDFAQGSHGTLLFIHPRELVMPARVDQAERVLAATGLAEGRAGESQGRGIPTFAPEKSCSATQLVYVLQSLRRHTSRAKVPTAVVVSAWDLVSAVTTPDDWLRRALPLLHQFLDANRHEHPFMVYGISALGGDIENTTRRAELLALTKASDRIRVVDGATSNGDITRPLTWLLDSME